MSFHNFFFNFILNGIRGLISMPKLIIILNGVKSKWALNEINQSKIIYASLIDSLTNINFFDILYPIPANVYSFSTQIFFCSIFKFNILNSFVKKKLFLLKNNYIINYNPKKIKLKKKL
jgi:ribosomal protein S2